MVLDILLIAIAIGWNGKSLQFRFILLKYSMFAFIVYFQILFQSLVVRCCWSLDDILHVFHFTGLVTMER